MMNLKKVAKETIAYKILFVASNTKYNFLNEKRENIKKN